MAKAGKRFIIAWFAGALGQQVIVKQYGDKYVVSMYPDMSKVKPSKLQEEYRKKMKEAVAYVQSILRNPEKKAAYQQQIGKDKSVYREAIKEYPARNKVNK